MTYLNKPLYNLEVSEEKTECKPNVAVFTDMNRSLL